DRVFLRAWFRRLKNSPPQPGQGERDQRKNQCYANENDDEQIGIRLHRLRSNSLGKHGCQVYTFNQLIAIPSEARHDKCAVEKTARKFRSSILRAVSLNEVKDLTQTD